MTNSTQESKTYIIHFRQQTLFAFRISLTHSFSLVCGARERAPCCNVQRETKSIPSHSFSLSLARTQCVYWCGVVVFLFAFSPHSFIFLSLPFYNLCMFVAVVAAAAFFNSLFLSLLTYSALCYFFFILIPLYIALTLLFFL